MKVIQRYATLDALRGIAAILVLYFHAGINIPFAAPHGYLAVDLFFTMSGFVLANAYEQKLREGMSAGTFLLRRLIRIYPLYFIAALMFGGINLQLLMIPDWQRGPAEFAPNVPMWSVFIELIVSALYGLWLNKLGWKGLGMVLAISGGLFIYGTVSFYTSAEYHNRWFDAPWLFAQSVFCFSIGVLLWRLHLKSASQQKNTWRGWILVLAMIAIASPLLPSGRILDFICIGTFFPVMIWLGAKWNLADSRLAAALGDASYALYCVHFPILLVAYEAGISSYVVLAALLPASWLLDRYYDRPIRRWLAKILLQSSHRAK